MAESSLAVWCCVFGRRGGRHDPDVRKLPDGRRPSRRLHDDELRAQLLQRLLEETLHDSGGSA